DRRPPAADRLRCAGCGARGPGSANRDGEAALVLVTLSLCGAWECPPVGKRRSGPLLLRSRRQRFALTLAGVRWSFSSVLAVEPRCCAIEETELATLKAFLARAALKSPGVFTAERDQGATVIETRPASPPSRDRHQGAVLSQPRTESR